MELRIKKLVLGNKDFDTYILAVINGREERVNLYIEDIIEVQDRLKRSYNRAKNRSQIFFKYERKGEYLKSIEAVEYTRDCVTLHTKDNGNKTITKGSGIPYEAFIKLRCGLEDIVKRYLGIGGESE